VQLFNPNTCLIASNHWSELLCAFWRSSHPEDEALPGIKPFISLQEINEFIGNCLSEGQCRELSACLSENGLFKLLVYEVTGESKKSDKSLETYILLKGNDSLNSKIKSEYLTWREKYPVDIESITAIHNNSIYDQSNILSGLIPDALKINLYPHIFMTPAPAGKLGFFNKEKCELIFIFGYSEKYGGTNLDWAQWYRMGVWHTILYFFWQDQWSNIGVTDEKLTSIYNKIPEGYISKVSIHGFNVGFHRNFASVFIDNLITVYKIVAENEVSGNAVANQQKKWFYSLGRFFVEWFLAQAEFKKPSDLDLSSMISRFDADLNSLTIQQPVFLGPLGSCEIPIWNRSLRLIFSPSVNPISRRILSIWFGKFWPVKPEIVDVSHDNIESWDDHCNLVFALSEDVDWIANKIPAYYMTGQQNLNVIGVQEPLVYVLRNKKQADKWTRICLADNHQDLVNVHNDIEHFSDWTSLVNGQKTSGRVLYENAGHSYQMLPN